MSHVSNYALFVDILDDEESGLDALPAAIVAVNEHLATLYHRDGFKRVDQHAGGIKAFEAGCFLMAGNGVPLESVLAGILSFDWQSSEDLLLVYQHQEQSGFSVLRYHEMMQAAAG